MAWLLCYSANQLCANQYGPGKYLAQKTPDPVKHVGKDACVLHSNGVCCLALKNQGNLCFSFLTVHATCRQVPAACSRQQAEEDSPCGNICSSSYLHDDFRRALARTDVYNFYRIRVAPNRARHACILLGFSLRSFPAVVVLNHERFDAYLTAGGAPLRASTVLKLRSLQTFRVEFWDGPEIKSSQSASSG